MLSLGPTPISGRYIDPNGKWSTEVHNKIFNEAFGKYLPEATIEWMKKEADTVDSFIPGQTDWHANDHAYATPEQGAGSVAAICGTQEVIDRHLENASRYANTPWKTEWAKEAYSLKAMSEFAKAAHTIMDRMCPAHAGYKVWDGYIGGVIGRDILETQLNLMLIRLHIQKEKDISPALKEAIAQEIRAAYQRTFNKRLVDQTEDDLSGTKK